MYMISCQFMKTCLFHGLNLDRNACHGTEHNYPVCSIRGPFITPMRDTELITGGGGLLHLVSFILEPFTFFIHILTITVTNGKGRH